MYKEVCGTVVILHADERDTPVLNPACVSFFSRDRAVRMVRMAN